MAPELKLIPVCYWSVFTTPLGFALSKILEKIQSLRPAAVPRNGTASQKTFFTILILCAPLIFLLGFALNRAGQRGFQRSGAAEFLPRSELRSASGRPAPHFCRAIALRRLGWRYYEKSTLSFQTGGFTQRCQHSISCFLDNRNYKPRLGFYVHVRTLDNCFLLP